MPSQLLARSPRAWPAGRRLTELTETLGRAKHAKHRFPRTGKKGGSPAEQHSPAPSRLVKAELSGPSCHAGLLTMPESRAEPWGEGEWEHGSGGGRAAAAFAYKAKRKGSLQMLVGFDWQTIF